MSNKKKFTIIAIIALILIGGFLMSYTPTTWTDEVLSSSPPLYNILNSGGSSLSLDNVQINLATSGSAGTALNAANMNKLELGLQAAAATADSGGAIATTFTTAGDLLTGSGAGTAIRLPVGNDYEVLQARAGATNKVEWSDVIGVSLYTLNSSDIVFNTLTEVEFTGAEVKDSNGFHSTVTNPGRITIPSGLGGLYLITINATAFTTTVGTTCRLNIGGNNSLIYTNEQWDTVASINKNFRTLTHSVWLNDGDYFSLYVEHDDSSSTMKFSYITMNATKLR